MVRGNCKATINSNYTATRLTPPNPTPRTSNIYTGEMTKSAIADDGRVFYAGRAICYQGYTQITNWDSANVGLGCGTVHVWDPRVARHQQPEPGEDHHGRDRSRSSAPRARGRVRARARRLRTAWSAIALDPNFTKGRPYIYVQYFPYYGGEQGKDTTPDARPGLRPQRPTWASGA